MILNLFGTNPVPLGEDLRQILGRLGALGPSLKEIGSPADDFWSYVSSPEFFFLGGASGFFGPRIFWKMVKVVSGTPSKVGSHWGVHLPPRSFWGPRGSEYQLSKNGCN